MKQNCYEIQHQPNIFGFSLIFDIDAYLHITGLVVDIYVVLTNKTVSEMDLYGFDVAVNQTTSDSEGKNTTYSFFYLSISFHVH